MPNQDTCLINYYLYVGGKEIDLIQAEKLREDSTKDEATATGLNDAEKGTKIDSKNIRNSLLFPVINENTLSYKDRSANL